MSSGQTTESNHELDDIADQAMLSGRPVARLQERFDSESELVDFLETGNSPSDIDGVGGRTANKLMHWFGEEHPDAHHRMREGDDSVFTEFETDEGSCGTENEDGEPIWGAYCPQEDCDHLNLFKGNPDEFAGRVFHCQNCNWVSLMDTSVQDLEVV